MHAWLHDHVHEQADISGERDRWNPQRRPLVKALRVNIQHEHASDRSRLRGLHRVDDICHVSCGLPHVPNSNRSTDSLIRSLPDSMDAGEAAKRKEHLELDKRAEMGRGDASHGQHLLAWR